MSFLHGASRELVCLIKTGIYTGDGTLSQAITGIGFPPKYVKIWRGAATNYGDNFERADVFTTDLSCWHNADQATYHIILGDRIISLDSDGFTVDDAGVDNHPNKDGYTYWFLALG